MDPLAIARRLFLKRLARYGATAALLTGGGKALAGAKTSLTGIRVSQTSEDHTRVVFDLSSGTEHKLFTLSNPPRVVIDLKGTREGSALSVSNKKTSLMRNLRSADKSSGDLRVVLDLKSKVRPRSFSLQPDGKSGHRLVVDLHGTNLSPTPIKTSQQEQRKHKKEYIIAVDAGHGGRDPGAVGKKGTREKDITLAVAKKMKTLIYRVFEKPYKMILNHLKRC